MSLAAVRLAMMTRFASISGVAVPADPLPKIIDDKTIIVFPRMDQSSPIGKGATSSSVAVQSAGVMWVEYHRRIPYEHLGSTMGDITAMFDTISSLVWAELAGGRFDGTITSISQVSLVHLGELTWNEWTFGIRIEISFTYLTAISA